MEGPTTSDLAIGQSILLPDGMIQIRRDDDAGGNAVVEEVTERRCGGCRAQLVGLSIKG